MQSNDNHPITRGCPKAQSHLCRAWFLTDWNSRIDDRKALSRHSTKTIKLWKKWAKRAVCDLAFAMGCQGKQPSIEAKQKPLSLHSQQDTGWCRDGEMLRQIYKTRACTTKDARLSCISPDVLHRPGFEWWTPQLRAQTVYQATCGCRSRATFTEINWLSHSSVCTGMLDSTV